jgi:hypothetical protein
MQHIFIKLSIGARRREDPGFFPYPGSKLTHKEIYKILIIKIKMFRI